MMKIEEMDRLQYDNTHDENERYVDEYHIEFTEEKVGRKKVFDILPTEIIEI